MIKLDSINRKKVKYCPCGKSNADGKFVPFKGYEKYGYCHSCDKTIKPEIKLIDRQFIKKKPDPPKEYFDRAYYQKLLFTYDNDRNNFVNFLERRLGVNDAKLVIEKYLLGTGESGAVIFPHIDVNGNIIGLKTMNYNPESGRSIKNFIHWDNSVKHRYRPCLFGLHLLDQSEKKIAIVEAEKTAVLMSIFMPCYTWMACGGSNGLRTDKFRYFNGREVHLFPDVGWYNEWSDSMERLSSFYPYANFKISREPEIYAEKSYLRNGDDIADYYLSNYTFSHEQQKYIRLI